MSIRSSRTAPQTLVAGVLALSLFVVPARAQCPNNNPSPGPGSGPTSGPIVGSSIPSGSSSGARSSLGSSGVRATNTPSNPTSAVGSPLFGSAASSSVRGASNRGGRTAAGTGGYVDSNDDPDRWSVWWDRNEDDFLWSRVERRVSRAATTAAQGSLSGQGRRQQDDGSMSRAEIYTRIVPDLLALVQEDVEDEVLDATLMALGQAVAPPFHDPLMEALPSLLAHHELGVQTAATLAMGLVGATEATETLIHLATCSSRGHALVGAASVPASLRAAAALALGYGNDPAAVQPLMDMIARLPASEKPTRTAAAMALGLMDNPGVGRAAAWMARQLGNRRLEPAVAAALPVALARLGRPGSREALLGVLGDRDADRWVVQSTAIALGRLVSMDDAEALEALFELYEDAKDGPTRHFALLSLARIGAADDSPASHREAHAELLDLLSSEVTRPDRRLDRPWAGLAAGIYGRAQLDVRPRLAARLIDAYDDVHDAGERGAYALGLGLLEAEEAADRLRSDYGEVFDDGFRRHVATALGLMGDSAAADVLVGDLGREGMDGDLRRALGASLRLLGDDRAQHVASATFQESSSLDARLSAARSLGMLRDQGAVPMLTAAAQDDGLDPLSRASACAALGRVIEKTTLPWYARACIDSNHVAPNGALDQVLALR